MESNDIIRRFLTEHNSVRDSVIDDILHVLDKYVYGIVTHKISNEEIKVSMPNKKDIHLYVPTANNGETHGFEPMYNVKIMDGDFPLELENYSSFISEDSIFSMHIHMVAGIPYAINGDYIDVGTSKRTKLKEGDTRVSVYMTFAYPGLLREVRVDEHIYKNNEYTILKCNKLNLDTNLINKAYLDTDKYPNLWITNNYDYSYMEDYKYELMIKEKPHLAKDEDRERAYEMFKKEQDKRMG